MSLDPEQVLITGKMIASPQKTEARFTEKNVKIEATAADPKLLIFSSSYRWLEERDNKLNDWDFYVIIADEKGEVIHSEYKHFGEDEPGFIGRGEESYKEYLKEEPFLSFYKGDDTLKKGDGTMVRSIKTPPTPGTYKYKFRLVSQFWSRRFGEERGLEKNKTEESDECTVVVKVR